MIKRFTASSLSIPKFEYELSSASSIGATIVLFKESSEILWICKINDSDGILTYPVPLTAVMFWDSLGSSLHPMSLQHRV